MIRSYIFRELLTLGSTSWSPDGDKICFNAVDNSGSNDLYVWDTKLQVLDKLTNDLYDDRDPDWSPDGSEIVFASDRSPGGLEGVYNLFRYSLRTRRSSPLVAGNFRCFSPRYSPDGKFILFASDRNGARNLWMIENGDSSSAGAARMVTSFTTGAFDPEWADGDLLFVGFQDFSFRIRMIEKGFERFAASADTMEAGPRGYIPWEPGKLAGAGPDSGSLNYNQEYTLDVAQS